MIFGPRIKIQLAVGALLASTLACRAATRLVIPDTPTPLPPTAIPATPTIIPTLPVEVSCPSVLADVVHAALSVEYNSDQNRDEEIYLASYVVTGNELGRPFYDSVPNDLKDEQNDRERHRAIWEYFTRLIPLEQREFLSSYSIVTDGQGEVLAAVGQTENNPEEWSLEVDILDSNNNYALTFTLLHEFAHLMTLNAGQVPPSIPVFKNPDDDGIYQSEAAACQNYFPGEGCSNPDSYINRFFDRFWLDLYAEWQDIDSEQDQDTYYNRLDDFYSTYREQFLSDYAPTSPAEDIAESFAFFVLSPKPAVNSIADEKILFFYEYPELIDLRRQIINQLCVEFPR